MNCSEVKHLLSAYYDGELSDELREDVLKHLDQCANCAAELHGFERLSQMASQLPEIPTPPEHLWTRIETELDQEHHAEPLPGKQPDSPTRRRSSSARYGAMAATVLLAVGIGWFILRGGFHSGHHNHVTAEFGEYLAEFRRDPDAAQQFLLTKYEHQRVEPDQSLQLVGYRPAVAEGMPPEYKLESTFVMKMPCCTCVQSLCQRSDGSTLAIFEHDEKTPQWFGNRPSITVNCHGRKCSLVELDGSTAVSWKRGDRYMTLIGIQTLSEVDRIVAWLDETKRPS